jgi:hypothetical protein
VPSPIEAEGCEAGTCERIPTVACETRSSKGKEAFKPYTLR